MSLSLLDTLADLATREITPNISGVSNWTTDNISKANGIKSDLNSIGEVKTESGGRYFDDQITGYRHTKRSRAYSESWLQDSAQYEDVWKQTKQQLLQMGKIVETGMTKVKNFNNNDNDAAEAEGEADIDMESDNTQGHIDAYNGNYTMYKYNDHCVENDVDRDDMSESSELTTELVSNATNLLTSLPDMVESYSNIYNKSNRIGVYTREERAIIIRRFHEKRARRVWKKKIRYHCRKNLADRRLRVKGRFIKAGSIEASKLGLEENHETTGDSGVDRDSDSVDIEQSNSRSSTNANASVSSSPSDIAPKISNKTKKEKNGKLIPNETMNQSVSLVSEENSDNGSNAASNAFDGFVGSPKSENAARNSLSVLLSVDSVNDNASAVVDGVSTSNTGKETNTDNLSMLGLYLLGKASQSSNHANGGVKNETNMYSNFNSGDKMRRHSIAY